MADAAEHTGWGVLVAVGDKSSAAKHLDRSLDKKADVTNATLVGPDLELRLVKTVVGRMLMNAEGTARAITQVADILVDVPSGTRSLAPAPTLPPPQIRSAAISLTQSWHPPRLSPLLPQ